MTAPTRKIGQTIVSPIGFGAMGLGGAYGKTLPDEERFQVRPVHRWSRTAHADIPKVLDAVYANDGPGMHLDTADVYFDNEELIGKWYYPRRYEDCKVSYMR